MDTLQLDSDTLDITVDPNTPQPTVIFEVRPDFLFGDGAQARLTGSSGGVIPNGAAVSFDQIMTSFGGVSYDQGQSAFIINEPGVYYATWWVVTDGAGPALYVSFIVSANGDRASGISPIVTGQLNGSALFEALPGTLVFLFNNTGSDVNLAAVPVQANMIVMRIGQL